jgi:hypothetical protein
MLLLDGEKPVKWRAGTVRPRPMNGALASVSQAARSCSDATGNFEKARERASVLFFVWLDLS